MLKSVRILGAFSLAMTAVAVAQTTPRPPVASMDPVSAPAGTYKLDERHASLIARVSHNGGISLSVFRFEKLTGTLSWDPAAIQAAAVRVQVDPKSITSAVPGFAETLKGDRFLKTAQYPAMSFASKRVERTGATTGRIMGDLTFMGVTKPLTIDASLVGVGRTITGGNAIGFTGKARFKRSDFGFTTMAGSIGDDVELLLDIEFNKAAKP